MKTRRAHPMTHRVAGLAALAVLPIGLLVACSDDDKPTNTTTPTGIANPASTFCIAQGGTVEIVDEAGGQVGYCNLADGTRVEEWEYYRSQTSETTAP